MGLSGLSRLVLLLATLLLVGCTANRDGPRYEQVTLADERFRLELALTRAEHRRGMAGREQVAADEGMLFVFRQPQVLNFWMKGCLIPLDIIFVDAGGRIVHTHTMPPPEPGTPDYALPSYSSRYPAQFAIEVKAGTVERLGLRPGDSVRLPLDRLKRLARSVDENGQRPSTAGASNPHGEHAAD